MFVIQHIILVKQLIPLIARFLLLLQHYFVKCHVLDLGEPLDINVRSHCKGDDGSDVLRVHLQRSVINAEGQGRVTLLCKLRQPFDR